MWARYIIGQSGVAAATDRASTISIYRARRAAGAIEWPLCGVEDVTVLASHGSAGGEWCRRCVGTHGWTGEGCPPAAAVSMRNVRIVGEHTMFEAGHELGV